MKPRSIDLKYADGMFLFQVKEIARKLDELFHSCDAKVDFIDALKLCSPYLDYLSCIYLLFESVVLQRTTDSPFTIFEITNQNSSSVIIEDERIRSENFK